MKKLIRITTVPVSLLVLLKGQLSFFSKYFEVIGVSNPDPLLEKVKQQEGIRTHGIKMTRSITPLKDLKSLIQMFIFFRKERPDIVHTHTPKAGIIGMLASKLIGVKFRIHTVAGLPLLEKKGLKRKLLEIIEILTYSCATDVLVNSAGLKEIIVNSNLASGSKLKVLGYGSSNGIDTGFFDISALSTFKISHIRTQIGLKNDDVIFIFVGRLVKDKGIEELIEAFKKISSDNPNAKLLLLGAREDKLDPLNQETNEHIKQNNNILELGFKEDVRPYMAVSDVLVHPSYREGFPNVVLQAGSMGKASIVTNINGNNEIIEHGTNGLIVEVKNSDALYKAMQHLLLDETYRISLGSNSRLMIQNKYEQEYVWNELLKYYKSLEV